MGVKAAFCLVEQANGKVVSMCRVPYLKSTAHWSNSKSKKCFISFINSEPGREFGLVFMCFSARQTYRRGGQPLFPEITNLWREQQHGVAVLRVLAHTPGTITETLPARFPNFLGDLFYIESILGGYPPNFCY